MKEEEKLVSELSKTEKKKIYLKADRFFEENDLKKVRKFFLEMTELDERLDWIIRLKNFFKRNRQATVAELKIIEEYFAFDDTLENNKESLQRGIQQWHEDTLYTTMPNLQSALETYSQVLGKLDHHYNIMDELNAVAHISWDEKKEKYICKHPIEEKIAERKYQEYIREKRNLIDALIEFHPKREAFIKIVPNSIKRTNPYGRKPKYPFRREITQSFWGKHEPNVKNQIRKEKVEDKVKDKDDSNVKINDINITADEIIEELKTQIPSISFLKAGTIKTWIGLK